MGRDDIYQAFAEINLAAASSNITAVKKISGGAAVFAVVKADAYAHGAVELSRAFIAGGASRLCAACPEEGIELRQAGIEAPVIILNPAAPSHAEAMAEHGLLPAIGDIETAERFRAEARRAKKILKIHVEIDTGMGRSGFLPGEAPGAFRKISGMDGIEIEGVFTHFACAGETDDGFTRKQLDLFGKVTSEIESTGIKIPLMHASNSAGLMCFPRRGLNAVRPGLLLYGISPLAAPAPTEPVLSLKTRIINIRKLPPGSPVGYGRTYTTSRETLLATLSAGYADGYDRRLSNRARVLINGKEAPVAGRICMDRCMVDITGINAEPGDEAVLVGKQGDKAVTIEELSSICGTVPNEFVSRLGKRVRRVYLQASANFPA